MTDALAAARRIVEAANHYLASVRAHGHKDATAEQALDCYTAAIEKYADVVARELLAREQAAGWRPIETAPKDGTTIDLWVVDFGEEKRLVDCLWHLAASIADDILTGPHVMGWCQVRDDYGVTGWWLIEGTPTHWMPAP